MYLHLEMDVPPGVVPYPGRLFCCERSQHALLHGIEISKGDVWLQAKLFLVKGHTNQKVSAVEIDMLIQGRKEFDQSFQNQHSIRRRSKLIQIVESYRVNPSTSPERREVFIRWL